ncbi:MAG: ribosomal RNA small subunit methyltransferase A [Alphaproteobacteria bacterium]|nr:ribosomal RNA small subunit methyltransferase A [Alphaproteobacteria bacterium]OJV15286.1 MAG: ribosomal RNA small subunit methyltransferase A [Alphaproteobacteria bacterium 33-17]
MTSQNIAPLKKLGQNFLKNPNTCLRIVNESNIAGKNVLEIGPGTGALTRHIVEQKPSKLILIEPDDRCIELLTNLCSNTNAKIFHEDALKLDFENITKGEEFHVISNLPYYISSEILLKLLKSQHIFPSLNLMFQKEVAERISAEPDNGEYGRLSVISQAIYDCEIFLHVGSHQFIPAPKVDSAVVYFTRKTNALNFDIKKLEYITQEFFMHRRKQIGKTLKKLNLSEDNLANIGVLPTMRAENISVEQYIKLANLI